MENRMKNSLILCTTSLMVLFTCPGGARADQLTPPTVPTSIQAPAGNKVFLVGHAVGTQNYICLPAATSSGFAWTLFGPQATLFDDQGKQIITHFLSANPAEAGTPRATWQHSKDTSAVWALAIANAAVPDAIPLLLLRVVGAQEGTIGSDRLTDTTFIHRLNTVGGVAPATGCALSSNVGARALIPYTADYFFYRDKHRGGDGNDDD